MNTKISELLQSIFSISALLGIICISAFIVTNLNPIAISEDVTVQGPNVAGVSTSYQSLNFINTASENSTYKTQLIKTSSKVEYIANFLSGENKFQDGFLNIQNTSSNNASFQIEVQIPEPLKNIIKVSIEDEKDLIHLNNLEKRVISVDKNSERKFKIDYTFNNPINFSFEIKFKIFN